MTRCALKGLCPLALFAATVLAACRPMTPAPAITAPPSPESSEASSTASPTAADLAAARGDTLATLGAISTMTAAGPLTAPPPTQPLGAAPTTPATPGSPTASPIPEALSGDPRIDFRGIRLVYDPSLASGWYAAQMPADDPDQMLLEAARLPAHTAIDWRGYLISETAQLPRLYVLPVEGFGGGYNPYAVDQIERLNELLADPILDFPVTAAGGGDIPLLPYFHAGQVLRAQVAYLRFQNGSGVRFLTTYAQDLAPINNRSLFYTFQGITDDGGYYVSLILPAAHPDLLSGADLQPEDFAPVEQDPPGYMTRMRDLLNGTPSSGFTPDLSLLDALVQSLDIAPE